QKLTVLPVVRGLLKRLKQQYLWREQVRSDLTRVLSALRAWHLVVADRFVGRGWIDRRDDYFMLLIDEVGAALQDPRAGAGLRAIVERRRAQVAAQQAIAMPMLMRESELPAILQPGGAERARGHAVPSGVPTELTGLCVSPGAVEAEVVVMT